MPLATGAALSPVTSRPLDPVEDALDHPARPPGDAAVVVTEGRRGGAEALGQVGELVGLGGERVSRGPASGQGADEVPAVPGAFAEPVGVAQRDQVGGGEYAAFPQLLQGAVGAR